MASAGAILLKGKTPYLMELDGNVNGIKFTVHGKGTGDASTGILEAKFVCTTGDLPVPWASILSTMTYGVHCFAKYPDNIKDFYKSALPEGYSQERTISFEGDGTYTTKAKVTFENGSIYNRVSLTGVSFKKDGHVLTKNYKFHCTPSALYILPCVQINGIRAAFNMVYELKDGGHQVGAHLQHNKPLNAGGFADIPDYHHITAHNTFSKDPEEKRDHMCVKEVLIAVDVETYKN